MKFIFATTEAHKVPETIVSRCQLHTFRRIPLAQVVAKLTAVAKAEGFGLEDETLALIARQAEGGMRDALSLLDQVVSSCGPSPKPEDVASALGAVDRRAVVALAAALCRREAGDVVRLLAEQYDRGNEPRRVGEALCQELRHLVVCKAVGTPPAELPDHEQKEIAALAKEADGSQLARLFDLVHGALGELGRAFEPQLALEVALLKGVFLAPGAQVSELLARVEALTKGGPIAGPVSPAGGGGLPRAQPAIGSGGPSAARPLASAAPGGLPPLQNAGGTPPGPAASQMLAPPLQPSLTPTASTASDNGKATASPRDDPSLPPLDRLVLLVKAAVAKSPRIGTALKNGRLKSIKAGELALAYPQGDFRAALLAAEKNTVDALLTAHFGLSTVLRICEGEEAGTELSIAERETQGTAERTEKVKAAALDSSAVKDALRVLGGQVEEIRVLGDPAANK